jgi:UPF0716 protein FxsA
MIYLVLFLMLPILEIAVFIKVGQQIGVADTLLLTVLTAVIGVFLLRLQGWQTWVRARQKIDTNQTPGSEIFDALCLFAAGILLLTPGFVTDTFGFLLFLPPFRALLRHQFKNMPNAFFYQSDFNSADMFREHQEHENRRQRPTNPKIIEGEYTELTDKDDSSKS